MTVCFTYISKENIHLDILIKAYQNNEPSSTHVLGPTIMCNQPLNNTEIGGKQ